MIDDDPINQDLVMREKEHPVNQGYGFCNRNGHSVNQNVDQDGKARFAIRTGS